MIKLAIFVVLIVALGYGFSWVADRPGDIALVWEGQLYQTDLIVAASALVAIIAAVMIAWWLVRTLWTSPHSVRRYFRARTRDRGYQAISTGLIAAGAGNAAMARKMSARARGLIRADQEPLILVLEAQAAVIEGKHDEARRLFQQMSEDPETRELGLRGLYVEASRLGAHEAARQYAEDAAEKAPYLPWAAKAALEYRCQSGQWDEAIRLLDQQRIAHVLSRQEADRLKAVLLTAKAGEQLEGDPAVARDNALHALKLAKDLVPAAVIAGKALLREDNLRKAGSVLEQAWKLTPHPDIARTYLRARSGDSAVDRLKRAERLESLKPNNVESLLIVAEAALDAKEFTKARAKAEAAARSQSRERVFLLLADIEDAETGDQGRIRYWMAQALRAPRDPAWVADGQVSEKWLPISPVSGRLDAFEWKMPYGQLTGPVEDGVVVSGAGAISAQPPLAPAEVRTEPKTEQPPVEAPAKPEVEQAVPAAADIEAEPSDSKPEAGAIPEPFFGRPPDDPGVRDPNRIADEKTRLRLF